MRDYKEELIDRIEEAEFELMLEKYQEDLSNACLKAYEQACARGEVEDMPEEIKEKVLKYINEYPCQSEKKRHPCRPLRYVLIIAATIAIVFSMLLTAQAVGYDVFGALGRWTDTVFHFGNNTTERIIQPETSNAELAELYGVLNQNNIPLGLIPSYLPEEYTNETVEVLENGPLLSVLAKYVNQEDTIVILVDKYHSSGISNSIWFEKNSFEAEEYQPKELLFYVFSDESNWVGVWQNEKYSVCIQTSSSKAELLSMLKTIEGVNDD